MLNNLNITPHVRYCQQYRLHRQTTFVKRKLSTYTTAFVVFVVEEKGSDIRCEDGRVDDENEDEPIPDSLKRWIMQNGAMMNTRWLKLVLRKYVRAQRQHLKSRSQLITWNPRKKQHEELILTRLQGWNKCQYDNFRLVRCLLASMLSNKIICIMDNEAHQ